MDEHLYEPLTQDQVLWLFALVAFGIVIAIVIAYERHKLLRNKEDDERIARELEEWKKQNTPGGRK